MDGVWYEEIAPTALYETEFEQLVLSQVALLYPNYLAVPFKTLVSSEDDTRRADFALIDKEYREWWVVEVELGHHSFENHVLPQVRTLSRASYGLSEAQYINKQLPSIDQRILLDMMKGKQPRVLVVVNTPRPEWGRALAPHGAAVATIEVFRSRDNRHTFRINGEYPKGPENVVSRCWLEPSLPRLMVVESPAAMAIPLRETVEIWYGEGVTEWSRLDAQDKVWLVPNSKNPLSMKIVYQLVRQDDGSLRIRQ